VTTKKSSKVVAKPRKKNPPRTAFKKGGPNKHAFKPGESGNPGGKPKSAELRLVTKALSAALQNRAPAAVVKSLGLPSHASWAQCIAQQLIIQAAAGDTSAASAVIAATEGTRARLDVFQENGNTAALPVIELVFIESDGCGRPASGITIEGNAQHPALPAGD
jgi:hypothetical protein